MAAPPQDHPHWKRMRFKGNKVWVAVDESRTPLVKAGKQLIKYQLDQPHEYWVHAAKVLPLDDDARPGAVRTTRKHPRTIRPPADDGPPPLSPDEAICIYTDGACSGNPGPAGLGVVMIYRGKTKEISRYLGIGTNNIAELEAIRAGLLAVRNRKLPVIVFTDSSYALGLLQKGWKAKQNQELVLQLRKLVATFDQIRFVKVRGHAGHPENERADQLAVAAIKGK